MKKTQKQLNLEFLRSKGWAEETNSRVTKYLALTKPGVDHRYFLGNAGAVRRGKTVVGSVSVKLQLDSKPSLKPSTAQTELTQPQRDQINDVQVNREASKPISMPVDKILPRPASLEYRDQQEAGKPDSDPTMGSETMRASSPPTKTTIPIPATATSPLASILQASIKQVNAMDAAPHVIVEARAGCLAADTIINVNRAGKGSEMTIEKLVKQFTGVGATCVRSDTGNTVRMRPWDLSIPTRIARAVNDVIMLGTVKNAWYSGDKETYTLETHSGRTIRATGQHPFLLSNGEWKTLVDLEVGDVLQVNGGRGKPQGSSGFNKQYQNANTRYHPYQVHSGSGRFSVSVHRLIIESLWNDLPFYDYVYYLRSDQDKCQTFQYLEPSQIVHHKNEDPTDNRVSNLEVLNSVKEHSDRHDWGNNVLYQVGYEEVVSIEPFGIEPTYDIEMASEPHNFLANGFAVHNSGKTTTLVSALQILKGQTPTDAKGNPITPSPQQQAVWDAVAQSRGVKSVCFVAFNKSIADELRSRVPAGCDAMTMHSMGYRAVTKMFGRQEPTEWAVKDIICDLQGWDSRTANRDPKKQAVLKAADALVSLCKMNLITGSEDSAVMVNTSRPTDLVWEAKLEQLASYYEVDLNGSRREVFNLVPRVLEACKAPKGKITFDDMVWLPVILNLSVFQYDILLGDEVQDWNRCQQALAKMAGKRLILCGDPKQAIYGFAGADADSMPRMAKELAIKHVGSEDLAMATLTLGRGCITLPLTVTRRCGKAIVAEANKIVADFSAHESNGEGKVSEARYPDKKANGTPWEKSYAATAAPGDMVLCRVNAPLVSQCFGFLRRGIKANIQGRDVGKGLISTVNKMKADSVTDLVAKLDDWLYAETAKEQAKRNPSEAKMIAVQDRVDCLHCFCEGAETVDAVIKKIEQVFTDDKHAPGIQLSSCHKAKGLEAHRVFLLEPEGCSIPHPMAKSEWQRAQEWNIRYVAITRAIEELVYVS